jgi:hypothetical protein
LKIGCRDDIRFFFVSLQHENEYQLETVGNNGNSCLFAYNINKVILYVLRYIYGIVANRQFVGTVGGKAQEQKIMFLHL